MSFVSFDKPRDYYFLNIFLARTARYRMMYKQMEEEKGFGRKEATGPAPINILFEMYSRHGQNSHPR